MRGQAETAPVLTQFRQHALVVGTAVDLELVDEHQVAPPLFRWQDGLLRHGRLKEAQQHGPDQFREVGPDHAAGRADQQQLSVPTTSRRSMVERGCPRMRRATRELANLESLVITEEVISRCWWASIGS